MDSLKREKILSAIDDASARCKSVSKKIFEWKELGPEELKSSRLLMDELRSLGFNVAGDLKVPADLVQGGIAKTAFRAEKFGKSPGPTVTIMLEYDALPNGHSCGHNLIAASGLLAACGLSQVMRETPGRVIVIGTPDEERSPLGGGKIALLEGGHFEGTDVVLTTHPLDRWSIDQRLLAVKEATFTFRGKAAHSAVYPYQGINALNAVLLTIHGINMLREHVPQDVRIHGMITKGGDRPNIVPELAETQFMVRSLDTATMESTYRKVVNCARAGELATGAKLEFNEPRIALKAPIIVPELSAFLREHLIALGVPEHEVKDHTGFGSSDVGNVAFSYPTAYLSFKIASEGTVVHSDLFREAAASEEGWRSTVVAGKVIALTAYEFLTDSTKVNVIQQKFKELKAT